MKRSGDTSAAGGGKRKKKRRPVTGKVSLVASAATEQVQRDRANTATTRGAGGVASLLQDTSLSTSERGRRLFAWLIDPIPVDKFYQDYWEKKPLLVKRHARAPDHYKGVYSSRRIEQALASEHGMEFGTDFDITAYRDGQRVTLNLDGRADPKHVWSQVREHGCSLRVLRPQEHSDPMWRLCALLETEWGSGGGANAYLTPSASQGFAPHYDDVEAFVLQLEGRKHWRVYAPRSEDETLPRFSSGNFGPDDDLGGAVIDVTLEPGDMLYFPRGWLHQARTVASSTTDAEDDPAAASPWSLHVTVSCGQRHAWCDFLEAAMAQTAQRLLDTRSGLPRDMLRFMGLIHADSTDPEVEGQREGFRKRFRQLWKRVLEEVDLDAVADLVATDTLQARMPPPLTVEEAKATRGAAKLTVDDRIRLVAADAARIVLEPENLFLYHCVDNPRAPAAIGKQSIEFDVELCGPGLEQVLKAYPNWIRVGDISFDGDPSELAQVLYDNGIVLARRAGA